MYEETELASDEADDDDDNDRGVGMMMTAEPSCDGVYKTTPF